jgi:prepilin-type N-terminal cleavage/methylation domain-containing protein
MKKGFTLIELLAVIVILAIILVIAVPQILSVIEKAKQDTLNIDAGNIAHALEVERIKDSTLDVESLVLSDLDNYGIDSTKYDEFVAQLIDDEVIVTITKDAYVGKSITDAKVYGVSWDGTVSTLVRTDDSVGLTYTVNTSTIDSDFDDEEIYSEMTEETDSYGNQFIKIPKFYIKKTTDGTNWTWQISKNKQDNDYYLPSCFYDEQSGETLSYVLVSKYNASLSADETKLESKTNKLPLVNMNISQLRILAEANGEGYQLLDIHVVDLIQTLFYVEYANLDSQTVMYGFANGQPNTSHLISGISGTTLTLPSGAAANYRVGQMIYIGTGRTGVRAKDLRITNVSGDDITYEVV